MIIQGAEHSLLTHIWDNINRHNPVDQATIARTPLVCDHGRANWLLLAVTSKICDIEYS
jgi:hypothetical protein